MLRWLRNTESRLLSWQVGAGTSYKFLKGLLNWLVHLSFHVQVDEYSYDYENFRDIRVGTPAGEEPLYSFDALVSRGWVTAWY